MKLRNHIHFHLQNLRSRANLLLKGPHPNPVYLFILAGPRTASTLLADIINTSPNVSRNNPLGEGQYLPELKGRYPHRWNALKQHDWSYIRSVWMRYWDLSKPILLEKSPPNMKHAQEIAEHFDPAYFLCLVRDPYAHCESLMRRTGYDAKTAAEFALECLALQKENLKLPNTHLLRYCDITDRTDETVQALQEWLPQLGPLRTDRAYGYSGIERIRNTNAEKIAKIKDIDVITEIFARDEEILQYFGYSLIANGVRSVSVADSSRHVLGLDGRGRSG